MTDDTTLVAEVAAWLAAHWDASRKIRAPSFGPHPQHAFCGRRSRPAGRCRHGRPTSAAAAPVAPRRAG